MKARGSENTVSLFDYAMYLDSEIITETMGGFSGHLRLGVRETKTWNRRLNEWVLCTPFVARGGREEPDNEQKVEAQTREGLGDKARTTLRWAAALRPKKRRSGDAVGGKSV
jgi:hypothetical protein